MTPTRSPQGRGWFVTLEGPEGAGKTTQAASLHAALERSGLPVLLVREPGGTPLGEAVRSLLLDMRADAAPITPRADALLFSAARAQLVHDRIAPALAAGATVIASRFADSTLAYQGAGMGLSLEDLRSLEAFSTGGLRPDVTVLLDLPAEDGLARKHGVEETRFESAFDVAFHRRVRNGFLALAAAEPDRFVTIDARLEPDAVFDRITGALTARLGLDLGSSDTSWTDGARESSRSEPNDVAMRITS